MGCGSASIFMKVALGLSVLALLFHLIGYGSNSWQRAEILGKVAAEEGLWKTCNYALRIGCRDYNVLGGSKIADEMRTVRAFTTIALIILIAVSVAILLSLFIDFLKKKLFLILEMAGAVAAGVLIFIAVIIYGSDLIPQNTNVHASWSLALCVVAALLSIATGILVVVSAIRGKKDSSLK